MVKFGRKLESLAHAPWIRYYVDYKALKKLLKRLKTDESDDEDDDGGLVRGTSSQRGGAAAAAGAGAAAAMGADASGHTDNPITATAHTMLSLGVPVDPAAVVAEEKARRALAAECSAAFMAKLTEELEKVNAHFESVEEEQAHRMLQLADLRKENAENPSMMRRRELMALETEVTKTGALLRSFSEVNYTAFFKILKKHDKMTKLPQLATFMATVDAQPFRVRAVEGSAPMWEDNVDGTEVYARDFALGFRADVEKATAVMRNTLEALRLSLNDAERKQIDEYSAGYTTAIAEEAERVITDAHGKGSVKGVIKAAKSKLWGKIATDVATEIGKTNPEHAAAVEQLQLAHEQLFGYDDVDNGGADGKAGDAESDTASLMSAATTTMHPSALLGALRPAQPAMSASERAAITRHWDARRGERRRHRRASMSGLQRPRAPSGHSSHGAAIKDIDDGYVHERPHAPTCSRSWFERYVPLPEVANWLPKYDFKSNLKRDITAGITIGVMVVPQGLAYATLANVPPIHGLYASLIPALVYSMFGTSKHAAIGPMSIPCLLVGAAVDRTGVTSNEERVAVASVIALLVAAFCIVMGTFQLGFLVRFISNPVLKGFASAAALVTLISVSKDIFGIKVAKSAFLHEAVPNLTSKLYKTHGPSLAMGIAGLVFMITWKLAPKKFPRLKRLKKVPGSLVAVILFIIVSFIMCEIMGITGRARSDVVDVVGTGATLPATAYAAAIDTYGCSRPHLNVTYEAVGSATGTAAILSGAALFAGTDVPPALTPALSEAGILAIPTVLTPVVPVLRLPGLGVDDVDAGADGPDFGMVLDCDTLGRVFAGDIAFWDDPVIVAQNAPLAAAGILPHREIVVAVREAGSGASAAFTRALAWCSPTFAAAVAGAGTSAVSWPDAPGKVVVEGDSGMAQHVRSNDYSIGYSSLAVAGAAPGSVPLATIRVNNSAGVAVRASAASVQAAAARVTAADLLTFGDDYYEAAFASTNESWPIMQASYMLFSSDGLPAGMSSSCEAKREALQLAAWMLTSPDFAAGAASAGFAAIPAHLAQPFVAELLGAVCEPGGGAVLAGGVADIPLGPGYWGCQEGFYSPPAETLKCSGIAVVGDVPAALPSPKLPSLPWDTIVGLVTDAGLITVVAFLESIAVAKTYSVRFSYDVDPSTELVALGFANAAGALFQGFPVMGGFSRSAVNADSGARSQLSLAISAIALGVLLLLITPAIFYLPKPVLSAIVITAVGGLIDVNEMVRLWSVNRRDLVVMLTAFGCTLFLGVETGILLAMGLSILIFIWVSTNPSVPELGRLRGTVVYRELSRATAKPGGVEELVDEIPRVRVVAFLGPLWFANSYSLKEALVAARQRYDMHGRAFSYRPWDGCVLDASNISFVDSTAQQALDESFEMLKAVGVRLVLAEANASVVASLQRGESPLADGIFLSVHDAVKAMLARSARKKLQKGIRTVITGLSMRRQYSKDSGLDERSPRGSAESEVSAAGGTTATSAARPKVSTKSFVNAAGDGGDMEAAGGGDDGDGDGVAATPGGKTHLGIRRDDSSLGEA